MLTANSTNLFILFWGGSQVLSGYFIKRNLVNLSFHVLKYGTLKETVYILSRLTPLRRKPEQSSFF